MRQQQERGPRSNGHARSAAVEPVTRQVDAGRPLSLRLCFRELATEMHEQRINYTFDMLRFELEANLSRPFSRPRFDEFGQKIKPADGKACLWEIARKIRDDVEKERNKASGIALVKESRLFRSQCELRTLAAQCSAFIEDFDTAFHELRLALSGLDPDQAKDRFLHGVIHGLTAEVYLLRADSSVRRGCWERGEYVAEDRRKYGESVAARRSHALKDLWLASSALDSAEAHVRAVRPNVSRWEWLYELRAQLVVERILLRGVDLDFGIGLPADSWKFIGGLQQDITEGLEAVRAGIDCTMQPTYASDGGLRGDPNYDHTRTYNCLVFLWFQIMLASFWVFRLFSLDHAHQKRAMRDRGLAPLLGTDQMFDTHGSRQSFTKRWWALNQAAGFDRYVEKGPKAFAEKALVSPNSARGYYTQDGQAAFLREFMLAKMSLFRKSAESEASIFGKFLEAVAKTVKRQ
jgi:hypothetical protein